MGNRTQWSFHTLGARLGLGSAYLGVAPYRDDSSVQLHWDESNFLCSASSHQVPWGKLLDNP